MSESDSRHTLRTHRGPRTPYAYHNFAMQYPILLFVLICFSVSSSARPSPLDHPFSSQPLDLNGENILEAFATSQLVGTSADATDPSSSLLSSLPDRSHGEWQSSVIQGDGEQHHMWSFNCSTTSPCPGYDLLAQNIYQLVKQRGGSMLLESCETLAIASLVSSGELRYSVSSNKNSRVTSAQLRADGNATIVFHAFNRSTIATLSCGSSNDATFRVVVEIDAKSNTRYHVSHLDTKDRLRQVLQTVQLRPAKQVLRIEGSVFDQSKQAWFTFVQGNAVHSDIGATAFVLDQGISNQTIETVTSKYSQSVDQFARSRSSFPEVIEAIKAQGVPSVDVLRQSLLTCTPTSPLIPCFQLALESLSSPSKQFKLLVQVPPTPGDAPALSLHIHVSEITMQHNASLSDSTSAALSTQLISACSSVAARFDQDMQAPALSSAQDVSLQISLALSCSIPLKSNATQMRMLNSYSSPGPLFAQVSWSGTFKKAQRESGRSVSQMQMVASFNGETMVSLESIDATFSDTLWPSSFAWRKGDANELARIPEIISAAGQPFPASATLQQLAASSTWTQDQVTHIVRGTDLPVGNLSPKFVGGFSNSASNLTVDALFSTIGGFFGSHIAAECQLDSGCLTYGLLTVLNTALQLVNGVLISVLPSSSSSSNSSTGFDVLLTVRSVGAVNINNVLTAHDAMGKSVSFPDASVPVPVEWKLWIPLRVGDQVKPSLSLEVLQSSSPFVAVFNVDFLTGRLEGTATIQLQFPSPESCESVPANSQRVLVSGSVVQVRNFMEKLPSFDVSFSSTCLCTNQSASIFDSSQVPWHRSLDAASVQAKFESIANGMAAAFKSGGLMNIPVGAVKSPLADVFRLATEATDRQAYLHYASANGSPVSRDTVIVQTVPINVTTLARTDFAFNVTFNGTQSSCLFHWADKTIDTPQDMCDASASAMANCALPRLRCQLFKESSDGTTAALQFLAEEPGTIDQMSVNTTHPAVQFTAGGLFKVDSAPTAKNMNQLLQRLKQLTTVDSVPGTAPQVDVKDVTLDAATPGLLNPALWQREHVYQTFTALQLSFSFDIETIAPVGSHLALNTTFQQNGVSITLSEQATTSAGMIRVKVNCSMWLVPAIPAYGDSTQLPLAVFPSITANTTVPATATAVPAFVAYLQHTNASNCQEPLAVSMPEFVQWSAVLNLTAEKTWLASCEEMLQSLPEPINSLLGCECNSRGCNFTASMQEQVMQLPTISGSTCTVAVARCPVYFRATNDWLFSLEGRGARRVARFAMVPMFRPLVRVRHFGVVNITSMPSSVSCSLPGAPLALPKNSVAYFAEASWQYDSGSNPVTVHALGRLHSGFGANPRSYRKHEPHLLLYHGRQAKLSGETMSLPTLIFNSDSKLDFSGVSFKTNAFHSIDPALKKFPLQIHIGSLFNGTYDPSTGGFPVTSSSSVNFVGAAAKAFGALCGLRDSLKVNEDKDIGLSKRCMRGDSMYEMDCHTIKGRFLRRHLEAPIFNPLCQGLTQMGAQLGEACSSNPALHVDFPIAAVNPTQLIQGAILDPLRSAISYACSLSQAQVEQLTWMEKIAGVNSKFGNGKHVSAFRVDLTLAGVHIGLDSSLSQHTQHSSQINLAKIGVPFLGLVVESAGQMSTKMNTNFKLQGGVLIPWLVNEQPQPLVIDTGKLEGSFQAQSGAMLSMELGAVHLNFANTKTSMSAKLHGPWGTEANLLLSGAASLQAKLLPPDSNVDPCKIDVNIPDITDLSTATVDSPDGCDLGDFFTRLPNLSSLFGFLSSGKLLISLASGIKGLEVRLFDPNEGLFPKVAVPFIEREIETWIMHHESGIGRFLHLSDVEKLTQNLVRRAMKLARDQEIPVYDPIIEQFLVKELELLLNQVLKPWLIGKITVKYSQDGTLRIVFPAGRAATHTMTKINWNAGTNSLASAQVLCSLQSEFKWNSTFELVKDSSGNVQVDFPNEKVISAEFLIDTQSAGSVSRKPSNPFDPTDHRQDKVCRLQGTFVQLIGYTLDAKGRIKGDFSVDRAASTILALPRTQKQAHQLQRLTRHVRTDPSISPTHRHPISQMKFMADDSWAMKLSVGVSLAGDAHIGLAGHKGATLKAIKREMLRAQMKYYKGDETKLAKQIDQEFEDVGINDSLPYYQMGFTVEGSWQLSGSVQPYTITYHLDDPHLCISRSLGKVILPLINKYAIAPLSGLRSVIGEDGLLTRKYDSLNMLPIGGDTPLDLLHAYCVADGDSGCDAAYEAAEEVHDLFVLVDELLAYVKNFENCDHYLVDNATKRTTIKHHSDGTHEVTPALDKHTDAQPEQGSMNGMSDYLSQYVLKRVQGQAPRKFAFDWPILKDYRTDLVKLFLRMPSTFAKMTLPGFQFSRQWSHKWLVWAGPPVWLEVFATASITLQPPIVEFLTLGAHAQFRSGIATSLLDHIQLDSGGQPLVQGGLEVGGAVRVGFWVEGGAYISLALIGQLSLPKPKITVYELLRIVRKEQDLLKCMQINLYLEVRAGLFLQVCVDLVFTSYCYTLVSFDWSDDFPLIQHGLPSVTPFTRQQSDGSFHTALSGGIDPDIDRIVYFSQDQGGISTGIALTSSTATNQVKWEAGDDDTPPSQGVSAVGTTVTLYSKEESQGNLAVQVLQTNGDVVITATVSKMQADTSDANGHVSFTANAAGGHDIARLDCDAISTGPSQTTPVITSAAYGTQLSFNGPIQAGDIEVQVSDEQRFSAQIQLGDSNPGGMLRLPFKLTSVFYKWNKDGRIEVSSDAIAIDGKTTTSFSGNPAAALTFQHMDADFSVVDVRNIRPGGSVLLYSARYGANITADLVSVNDTTMLQAALGGNNLLTVTLCDPTNPACQYSYLVSVGQYQVGLVLFRDKPYDPANERGLMVTNILAFPLIAYPPLVENGTAEIQLYGISQHGYVFTQAMGDAAAPPSTSIRVVLMDVCSANSLMQLQSDASQPFGAHFLTIGTGSFPGPCVVMTEGLPPSNSTAAQRSGPPASLTTTFAFAAESTRLEVLIKPYRVHVQSVRPTSSPLVPMIQTNRYVALQKLELNSLAHVTLQDGTPNTVTQISILRTNSSTSSLDSAHHDHVTINAIHPDARVVVIASTDVKMKMRTLPPAGTLAVTCATNAIDCSITIHIENDDGEFTFDEQNGGCLKASTKPTKRSTTATLSADAVFTEVLKAQNLVNSGSACAVTFGRNVTAVLSVSQSSRGVIPLTVSGPPCQRTIVLSSAPGDHLNLNLVATSTSCSLRFISAEPIVPFLVNVSSTGGSAIAAVHLPTSDLINSMHLKFTHSTPRSPNEIDFVVHGSMDPPPSFDGSEVKPLGPAQQVCTLVTGTGDFIQVQEAQKHLLQVPLKNRRDSRGANLHSRARTQLMRKLPSHKGKPSSTSFEDFIRPLNLIQSTSPYPVQEWLLTDCDGLGPDNRHVQVIKPGYAFVGTIRPKSLRTCPWTIQRWSADSNHTDDTPTSPPPPSFLNIRLENQFSARMQLTTQSLRYWDENEPASIHVGDPRSVDHILVALPDRGAELEILGSNEDIVYHFIFVPAMANTADHLPKTVVRIYRCNGLIELYGDVNATTVANPGQCRVVVAGHSTKDDIRGMQISLSGDGGEYLLPAGCVMLPNATLSRTMPHPYWNRREAFSILHKHPNPSPDSIYSQCYLTIGDNVALTINGPNTRPLVASGTLCQQTHFVANSPGTRLNLDLQAAATDCLLRFNTSSTPPPFNVTITSLHGGSLNQLKLPAAECFSEITVNYGDKTDRSPNKLEIDVAPPMEAPQMSKCQGEIVVTPINLKNEGQITILQSALDVIILDKKSVQLAEVSEGTHEEGAPATGGWSLWNWLPNVFVKALPLRTTYLGSQPLNEEWKSPIDGPILCPAALPFKDNMTVFNLPPVNMDIDTSVFANKALVFTSMDDMDIVMHNSNPTVLQHVTIIFAPPVLTKRAFSLFNMATIDRLILCVPPTSEIPAPAELAVVDGAAQTSVTLGLFYFRCTTGLVPQITIDASLATFPTLFKVRLAGSVNFIGVGSPMMEATQMELTIAPPNLQSPQSTAMLTNLSTTLQAVSLLQLTPLSVNISGAATHLAVFLSDNQLSAVRVTDGTLQAESVELKTTMMLNEIGLLELTGPGTSTMVNYLSLQRRDVLRMQFDRCTNVSIVSDSATAPWSALTIVGQQSTRGITIDGYTSLTCQSSSNDSQSATYTNTSSHFIAVDQSVCALCDSSCKLSIIDGGDTDEPFQLQLGQSAVNRALEVRGSGSVTMGVSQLWLNTRVSVDGSSNWTLNSLNQGEGKFTLLNSTATLTSANGGLEAYWNALFPQNFQLRSFTTMSASLWPNSALARMNSAPKAKSSAHSSFNVDTACESLQMKTIYDSTKRVVLASCPLVTNTTLGITLPLSAVELGFQAKSRNDAYGFQLLVEEEATFDPIELTLITRRIGSQNATIAIELTQAARSEIQLNLQELQTAPEVVLYSIAPANMTHIEDHSVVSVSRLVRVDNSSIQVLLGNDSCTTEHDIWCHSLHIQERVPLAFVSNGGSMNVTFEEDPKFASEQPIILYPVDTSFELRQPAIRSFGIVAANPRAQLPPHIKPESHALATSARYNATTLPSAYEFPSLGSFTAVYAANPREEFTPERWDDRIAIEIFSSTLRNIDRCPVSKPTLYITDPTSIIAEVVNDTTILKEKASTESESMLSLRKATVVAFTVNFLEMGAMLWSWYRIGKHSSHLFGVPFLVLATAPACFVSQGQNLSQWHRRLVSTYWQLKTLIFEVCERSQTCIDESQFIAVATSIIGVAILTMLLSYLQSKRDNSTLRRISNWSYPLLLFVTCFALPAVCFRLVSCYKYSTWILIASTAVCLLLAICVQHRKWYILEKPQENPGDARMEQEDVSISRSAYHPLSDGNPVDLPNESPSVSAASSETNSSSKLLLLDSFIIAYAAVFLSVADQYYHVSVWSLVALVWLHFVLLSYDRAADRNAFYKLQNRLTSAVSFLAAVCFTCTMMILADKFGGQTDAALWTWSSYAILSLIALYLDVRTILAKEAEERRKEEEAREEEVAEPRERPQRGQDDQLDPLLDISIDLIIPLSPSRILTDSQSADIEKSFPYNDTVICEEDEEEKKNHPETGMNRKETAEQRITDNVEAACIDRGLSSDWVKQTKQVTAEYKLSLATRVPPVESDPSFVSTTAQEGLDSSQQSDSDSDEIRQEQPLLLPSTTDSSSIAISAQFCSPSTAEGHDANGEMNLTISSPFTPTADELPSQPIAVVVPIPFGLLTNVVEDPKSLDAQNSLEELQSVRVLGSSSSTQHVIATPKQPFRRYYDNQRRTPSSIIIPTAAAVASITPSVARSASATAVESTASSGQTSPVAQARSEPTSACPDSPYFGSP